MDPALVAVIAVIVGLALGALVTWLLMRTRANAATAVAVAERESALAIAAADHETAIAEERAIAARTAAAAQAELSAARASVDGLREQVAAAAARHKDLVDRGEREARERQAQQQAESRVLQVLTPVQETLRTMQSKVIELETQRAQQHGELQHQLKAATEGEERLRATAESLAAALTNNVERGAWGETRLRTLVESVGLLPHVDFTEQSTIAVEDAARRPDMVINLPGGKQMAVDSKVPYNDFIKASQIPFSATGDDEIRRRELLRAHAKRVRGHVDTLSSKSYWSGLEASPDFTIAFIPNEALLAAAMEGDPELMDYAMSKNIVLASPISLWSVLKTVAFTWRQDVLTEDAKRLFDLSRELYTRIATLADHADKLRRSIDGTVASYNAFASSLETRVLVTARKLGDLDETKLLAEPRLVEERPKALTAPELTAGPARDELTIAELIGEEHPFELRAD